MDKNRLQLAWISAAEGQKFASKMKKMQKIVDGVTTEEIEKTVASFAPKQKIVDKPLTQKVKKNGVSIVVKNPKAVFKR